ncbi:golgin-84 [Chelonus insularis]|uniref:golgin-84 n=1 Tax=Chelonus insularis TaxID=460826 RepID=UPI00158A6293|nr:golgin-84 [Chelonus insularis]
MAWLSDLAGKAENILNKIDQNTAAVLSKDKNDTGLHGQLTAVPWTSSHDNSLLSTNYSTLNTSKNSQLQSPQKAKSNLEQSMHKEEGLVMLLNTPATTPIKKFINDSVINKPTIQSTTSRDHFHDKDATSEYSTHTNGSSLLLSSSLSSSSSSISSSPSAKLQHTLVNVPDTVNQYFTSEDDPLNTYSESSNFKKEIDEKENEILLIENNVDKFSEDEEKEKNQKHEYETNPQNFEVDHLLNSKKLNNSKSLKTSHGKLEEQNKKLYRQYTDNQKEIEKLKEQLRMHEVESIQYIKQITDLQSVLEKTRLDLQSTRQELEQHRARALKTLQEKEKLISELKDNNLNTGIDNSTTIMEMNQLKQECSILRQENQQLCEQLKIAREELVNADVKMEECNRKIVLANREAYEIISNEKKRRVEAEEDARIHLEETRKLKDELSSQLNNWSVKLRKQESEISRLKSRLSAVSTPSSAVETRLATLTQTLVTKQNELASLTTEKNALKLQLERVEHEYRRNLSNMRKGYNVNDTDDAKAQVPEFLMETPFDTGVTRRVKRAYSTLDAISVRIGLFLRRYPLARIFVIIYIAFLQLWVLIVLFFQSPDVH